MLSSTCRIGLLALILASVPAARADDQPFDGKWKILIPQGQSEIAMWIVHIDIPGKHASVVAGLGPYNDSTISGVRVQPRISAMTLTHGDARFDVVALAPAAANKRLLGSVTIGSTILPAWLEPTTDAKLDAKKAERVASGHAALLEAAKKSDAGERRTAMRAIAAKHPGELTEFLAHQMILADLSKQKVSPEALAGVVADYRELAKRHGKQMVLGANLDLARNLAAYPDAAAVCVDCASAAIAGFHAGHPPEMQITGHLALASALVALKKEDATIPVAASIDKLGTMLVLTHGATEAKRLGATVHTAEALLSSLAAPVSAVGLKYAKSGVAMLKPATPPEQQAAAYRALVRGLEKHGKPAEVVKAQAFVDHYEAEADAAFRKEAIPFAVAKAAPRKGKSRRVVLVELFSTAHDPACAAADAAFDAARKAYPSEDAVFLRYHVHLDAPDALANPAAVSRRDFYSGEIVETVPAALVGGQMVAVEGAAKANFGAMAKKIDAEREIEASATIALSAKGAKGKATISATVTGLAETGDKVRLRFAVVEDEVRYPGASGRRLHGGVVRGFLGDPAGVRLDKKDSTHAMTLDTAALRKTLHAHLSDYGAKVEERISERPMELRRLSVVAFVQHEDTKKVYQAARVEVGR